MHDSIKVCIHGEEMIREQALLAFCMRFLHYSSEALGIHIYIVVLELVTLLKHP